MHKIKGNSNQALVHSSINLSELWHRIFAHLHYKALSIARKEITGLLKFQVNHDGMCKGCAQGKNVKIPLTSSGNKAKGFFDIVHSDVCGLMLATSLSRNVYYVSFINDFSCKTLIYFLKGKDEVSSKFKEFKPLVEFFFENKIKILRSNNGGEFT